MAEFCERTALTRDTIRFYVRKGLLRPEIGATGTNRYQTFDEGDVERALMIRNAQALGFTLREILALDAEFSAVGMSLARQGAVMRERVSAIDERIAALRAVRRYLMRKIAWLNGGGAGSPPAFYRAAHPAGGGRSRT